MSARASLDLGSLGRSDTREQSSTIGASALASQLLQHQQQNMSCGGTGMRSITARDILSDVDTNGTTHGGNIRGIDTPSTSAVTNVLQQNLEVRFFKLLLVKKL